MDKDKLIKELLQKGQDYSQQIYLVGFFIVFIILIIFVVRPTVNEYIYRNKELEQTAQLSVQYEKVISSLSALQSILESNRSDFGLLDQAIPENIGMYQLTQDVRNSFLNYVPTRSYSFPGYVVSKQDDSKGVKSKGELKPYKILVSVNGSYETLQNIFQKILNQRRIKSVKSFLLSRPQGASDSASLEMKLEIEAYYL